jgi:4,5:9,10-diseco-3-hydroxy-5,9,17-trioxoandrosta-1(10),2-diene-4-oate hydrolase
MPLPEDRYVDVEGVRTRYWQEGSSGTPVLLLHGIACSVLEWRHNLSALSAAHVVTAVDLPGHGLSGKPGHFAYDIPGLARFVLAFMDRLGLQRVHLAGNSLGGRLALECARLAPKRLWSMTLLDPAGVAPRPTLLEFRLASVQGLGELLTRPNPMGTCMLWRKAFAAPDRFVTDELVDDKCRLARQPGAHAAFLRTLRSFVGLGGFEPAQVRSLQEAMPGLHTPALVIWGRQDRFVPCAHAEVLRERLPDVRVQIWDHCGHVPMIECAHAFQRELLSFAASVEARVGA